MGPRMTTRKTHANRGKCCVCKKSASFAHSWCYGCNRYVHYSCSWKDEKGEMPSGPEGHIWQAHKPNRILASAKRKEGTK